MSIIIQQFFFHQQAQASANYEANIVATNERMQREEQEQHQFESSDGHSLPTTQPSIILDHRINVAVGENELECNNAALEADMMRQQEAKQQQQRENEINTAIRSLTTNLYLCLIFISVFLLTPVLNQLQEAIVTSLLKTFAPVLSTISNFVKIHTLVIETFVNCKNKVAAQLNYI